MDQNFRTVAVALQPFISDTYTLLNAADAVVQALAVPETQVREQGGYTHRELVDIACGNETIVSAMMENRKIPAIKELRAITGQGLRATKEAVEDSEMSLAVLRYKLTGRLK